jgi:hypothetical protein
VNTINPLTGVPEGAPASARFPWLTTLVVFTALWAVAFWPALNTPWW